MKIRKRIMSVLLAVCLLVPCFSNVVLAADGIIFFSDLETKVGDTFTITGTVVARNDVLGEATVEMSYDTSCMQFMEGEGVTDNGSGKLVYTGSGNGSSDRTEFTMKFQALKEGDTRLEQGTATVTTESGESVTCEEGYADISIGEGDPSKIQPVGKSAEVTIDGVNYTLSEAFSEAELPENFATGEFTYNGETYKGAVQANSGITIAYLVDDQKAGSFWVYNTESGEFYPFEEIVVSDTHSIVILNDISDVKLPKKYVEASVEINGQAFPAWLEPDRAEFYIMYAVNNEGQKSLYLYDSSEHTYQRMETPKTASTPKKKATTWDKITEIVTDYLLWIMVGVGCLVVILLVFLIVLAVKLHHRNVELDDLYDEYSIDSDNVPGDIEDRKVVKQSKSIEPDYDDLEDEDFDDDYDDDLDELKEDLKLGYQDDDFDGLEDEDFDDDFDGLDDDDFDGLDDDDFDDFDDDFDDFDDEYEEEPVRKSSSKRAKKADTFEMDFIDLD
ncbi:hypothetical protein ABXS75_14150 [Roseburia hominis]